MKSKSKNDRCLNCGYPLQNDFDYCPICGQKNTDLKISFWQLLKEFFSNYISFDSRFAQSVKPFFFKPGKLTLEFSRGKRVKYAHPIRLYLLISLVYFFIFQLVANDFISRQGREADVFKYEVDSVEADEPDSVISELPTVKSESIIDKINLRRYNKIKDNPELSDEQVLDSIAGDVDFTPFQRHVALQTIKANSADPSFLANSILGNIPVMMIFLVPLFGLLLKLFYFRKPFYFIDHLIHAVHLHSFAYILFGVSLPVIYFNREMLNPGAASFFILTLVIIYAILSLRRTYRQGWVITFFKFGTIAFMYFYILVAAMVAELLISLLTF